MVSGAPEWVYPILSIALGFLIASLPYVFLPIGTFLFAAALFISPLLVWYGLLRAVRVLRWTTRRLPSVGLSLSLYLAAGSIFSISFRIGAWCFGLDSALGHVVFALAWPPLLLWILFACTGLVPVS